MGTLKNKIQIAVERLCYSLPERQTRQLSIAFTKIKKQLSVNFHQQGLRTKLIHCCDFIIVRTAGNRFIEFELTNICNARCIFCPYPDMLKSGKKFMNMNEKVLSASIDKLKLFPNTLISFTPTTGDTLLHPEWDSYMEQTMAPANVKQATFYTNAIVLDKDNCDKLIALIKRDKNGKLSQLFFSVGGLDRETYKTLYQVDRFDTVINNIKQLLSLLKTNNLSTGIHIHLKLLKEQTADIELAYKLLNPDNYSFLYITYSANYESNDGYRRNAVINYITDRQPEKKSACAYLFKTRFAADGGIWADGCVLSEMPGDQSLQLGTIDSQTNELEAARNHLIKEWEHKGNIPLPCRGCTIYKCRK